MSLIEEALRRLNDPLLKETSPAPPPTRQRPGEERAAAHSWPTASPARPSSAVNPLHLVVIAIAILTTALFIGGAFWLGRTLPGMSASVDKSPAAPAPQETIPPPPTPQEPEVTLTGIVVGAGAPYAVLNGSIAAVGDRVGAFNVQEIVEGAVTLRKDDGEELVLRTKR
jgi:hypothetical protein